ncbi:MAG: hypothetical protein ACRCZF_00775, partial [Gemmataceae bacterium]
AVLFAVAGIGFLRREAIYFGSYVLPRPYTTFIGLVLIIQLLIGPPVAFAIGAAEGVKAARTQSDVDLKKLKKKYNYLDVAVTGLAFMVALAIAVRGTTPYVPEYIPEEEVLGVRDLVAERDAERDTRRKADDRIGSVWGSQETQSDSEDASNASKTSKRWSEAVQQRNYVKYSDPRRSSNS